MPRLNNIKPKDAMKFLEEHGWALYNVKGSHYTYYKKGEDGKDMFCQVIANNKTIYWKNAKHMIKKSQIPEESWIEEFG